jgi:hypothetical protein
MLTGLGVVLLMKHLGYNLVENRMDSSGKGASKTKGADPDEDEEEERLKENKERFQENGNFQKS